MAAVAVAMETRRASPAGRTHLAAASNSNVAICLAVSTLATVPNDNPRTLIEHRV